MIGAQRGFDQVQIAPDDGVVIDIRHVLQRVLDLRFQVLCCHGAILGGWIELRHEKVEEAPRHVGIAVEHRRNEILALRNTRLLQIAAIGAQDDDLVRPQPRGLGERVVAVIIGIATPYRQQHILEQRAAIGDVDRLTKGAFELHIVDENQRAVSAIEFERPFADDACTGEVPWQNNWNNRGYYLFFVLRDKNHYDR